MLIWLAVSISVTVEPQAEDEGLVDAISSFGDSTGGLGGGKRGAFVCNGTSSSGGCESGSGTNQTSELGVEPGCSWVESLSAPSCASMSTSLVSSAKAS